MAFKKGAAVLVADLAGDLHPARIVKKDSGLNGTTLYRVELDDGKQRLWRWEYELTTATALQQKADAAVAEEYRVLTNLPR